MFKQWSASIHLVAVQVFPHKLPHQSRPSSLHHFKTTNIHKSNDLDINIFHILDDMRKDPDELPDFHDQRRRIILFNIPDSEPVPDWQPSQSEEARICIYMPETPFLQSHPHPCTATDTHPYGRVRTESDPYDDAPPT